MQVNLASPACEAEGCQTFPIYGSSGGRRVRCAAHRLENMVWKIARTAQASTCHSDAALKARCVACGNCLSLTIHVQYHTLLCTIARTSAWQTMYFGWKGLHMLHVLPLHGAVAPRWRRVMHRATSLSHSRVLGSRSTRVIQNAKQTAARRVQALGIREAAACGEACTGSVTWCAKLHPDTTDHGLL